MEIGLDGTQTSAPESEAPVRTTGPRHLVLPWTTATIVGELIGLGVAGLIGALATAILKPGSGAGGLLVVLPLAAATGLIEGGAVGGSQWLVLRRTSLEISGRSWVGATAVGGAIPWVIGMSAGTLVPEGSGPPSLPVMAAVVIAGGGIAGAMLGGCQALVLRRHAHRVWRWVAANGGGWAAGLTLVMLASAVSGESTPVVVMVAAWNLSGVSAGLLVGGVSGLVLQRIVNEASAAP